VNIRAILQLFAHLIGDAFRILPKRKRFAAARRIALAIAPLLRRTRWYAQRPSLLDGPREEALRMVLRTMTRAGVTFDPDVDIRGRALTEDGAILVVSGHFLLNIMMTRWVFDVGRRYVAGLAGPREPLYYAGTTVPLECVYNGPQMFVQLRRRIDEDTIIFITVEVPVPNEDWIAVDTVVGRRYISPATFVFAERTRTRVVFTATYLDGEGRVIVTYERPQSLEAHAMAAEFCEFLQRHVAAVER
jgi:hypothetical protein